MKCPECGSEDFTTWPYDFGTDAETGYRDSGVRACCRPCGHIADAEDFQERTNMNGRIIKFRGIYPAPGWSVHSVVFVENEFVFEELPVIGWVIEGEEHDSDDIALYAYDFGDECVVRANEAGHCSNQLVQILSPGESLTEEIKERMKKELNKKLKGRT